jgi:hypothetical protein
MWVYEAHHSLFKGLTLLSPGFSEASHRSPVRSTTSKERGKALQLLAHCPVATLPKAGLRPRRREYRSSLCSSADPSQLNGLEQPVPL